MSLSRMNANTGIAATILAISTLYFVLMWLGYGEAWLHPEQIKAAMYVWSPPTQSYAELFRKAFDWAALDTPDPTHWRDFAPAQRVRPLSDVAQVIDAITRPLISRLLYPHPSLTPSAILAAILAPIFFFQFLKLSLNSRILPLLFVALWLSSMGFLSVIVPDIHAAAKRLAILLFCACLYLMESHKRTKNLPTFWIFVLALFLSLFSDELALGGYVAICILYAPFFLHYESRWKALVVVALPAIYAVTTTWGLTALYALASDPNTPAFRAISDGKKTGLFAHLLYLDFYKFSLTQIARAMLITTGILSQNFFTELGALVALFGGSALLIWMRGTSVFKDRLSYGLVASAIMLVANGTYLTMLDLYPPEIYPPGQYPAGGTSYLSAYAYYYHSSLCLLTLIWLAFACRILKEIVWNKTARRQIFTIGGMTAATIVMVVNYRSFHLINQLVALAHYYPFDPALLYSQIQSVGHVVESNAGVETIARKLTSNCSVVSEKFNRDFIASMGQSFKTSPFNQYFQKFSLSNQDIGYLFTINYPQVKFDLTVVNDGTGCGIPHVKASPDSGPSGTHVTFSGYGFKPNMDLDLLWGSAGGLVLTTVTADYSGKFTDVGIDLPFHKPATYKIFASNYTGLAESTFVITSAPTATALATPDHAAAGEKVSVTGSGFLVGNGFNIRWNGPSGLPVGTNIGDVLGKIPATDVIIPQVPIGQYKLYVTDDAANTAIAPITVTPTITKNR